MHTVRTSLKGIALAGILFVAACSDDNNGGDVVEPPPPPPPPPPAPTLIQDMFGSDFGAIFRLAAAAEPNDAAGQGNLPPVSLTTDPIDF